MLKTVTINLAGQVFHIDENAYEALYAYIQSIRKFYSKEEGSDEIIADIEARFAEIFLGKLAKTGKSVVSLPEVEEVIALMGRPEEFEGEEAKEATKTEETKFTSEFSGEKRLYRDMDDKVVSGVCSGLANYFGIKDPVWIRLLFILAVFAGMSGVLLYFILMIIVPEAKTSAQKLQMKGEAVNLSNIEKTFKDGFKNVEDSVKGISEKEGPLYRFVDVIGKIFGVLFKVIGWFFKILFFIILGSIILGLVISLGVFAFSGLFSIPLVTDYIAETSGIAAVGGIGSFLLFGIPALALILLPFHMFSKNIRPFKSPVGYSMLAMFFIGLVMTGLAVADVSQNFSETESMSKESIIADSPSLDTIFITSKSNPKNLEDVEINLGWKTYHVNNDGFLNGQVKLNIEESDDTNFHIWENYSANGNSTANATKNLRNISYNYQVNGNHFTFNNFAENKIKSKKWRNQKVEVTLQIPSGTIIVFDEIEDLIESHPKIKTTWVEEPSLESSAWRLENDYLFPLDSNIIWEKEDDDSRYSVIKIKSDFDEISVKGLIDLEIIANHETKVLADFPDKIDVNFEDGILIIKNKPTIILGNNTRPVKVKLYIDEINHIEIDGMTKATMNGFGSGSLNVRANGSSVLIMNDIFLDVLEAELNGVSTLKGDGNANEGQIKASGASIVETRKIQFKNMDITLNGVSQATVNVVEELKGNVNGSSELNYIGDPSIVNVSNTGVSKVKSIK
jgi:phage shock protein PspC (stress-responsive transcriptional regulator)